jgi:hypothetical protein
MTCAWATAFASSTAASTAIDPCFRTGAGRLIGLLHSRFRCWVRAGVLPVATPAAQLAVAPRQALAAASQNIALPT